MSQGFSEPDAVGLLVSCQPIFGRQGIAYGIRTPVLNVLTVITGALTNISTTTATTNGTLVRTGETPVLQRGFCWNTAPDPTIELPTKTVETGPFSPGSFTGALTGLTLGTQYYVRAYATNATTTVYGQSVTFTTLTLPPTVSVVSATSISGASATITANVTDIGGATVSTRGFVWDINPNPTIALTTKVQETGSFGTGQFTRTLTGLTLPTYYVRAFATNVSGNAYSADIVILEALYAFTTHTFTNAAATGRVGPTLSQCRTAYAAANWTQNNSFFNMTTQGIQRWTVPQTATYTIRTAGGQGGRHTWANINGGLGAIVESSFSLTQGQVLSILVGQKGEDNRVSTSAADNAGPGGGGASYVFVNTSDTFPLLSAGAGAGGSRNNYTNAKANTTTGGNNAESKTNGGSSGNGGTTNAGGGSYWAGAGSGWLTDGTGGNQATNYNYLPGSQGAQGGRRPANGGLGGIRWSDGLDEGGDGGFGGGGGGGSDNMGTGGGAGYSGGGGGNSTPQNGGGGGGGSYSQNALSFSAVTNTGNGYVIITKV